MRLIGKYFIDLTTVLPRHEESHFVKPGCLVSYKFYLNVISNQMLDNDNGATWQAAVSFKSVS